MLDGRSSARRNSATRAMSIRASGWVRRRLSIGPRVCPPARYFASPSAAAKILKASSRVSAREYEKRSEEHTSELQSLMRISYAVFCLKKKKKNIKINNRHTQI